LNAQLDKLYPANMVQSSARFRILDSVANL
jgi:hypothetical protein